MRARFDSFRGRAAGKAASLTPPEHETPGPRRPSLVVGLGNPGRRYRDTRHNVGAWCVALLAARHGVSLTPAGDVDAATLQIAGHELHLAVPRAHVNVSGPPVAAESRRLRLTRDRLLVVYDDLDLAVGQLRIRPHGGHGGHNGVRSLVEALGGGEFARVRIGIDRPYDGDTPVRDPERVAAWVLSGPPPEERRRLDEVVANAADAIERAVIDGIALAMNRHNP